MTQNTNFHEISWRLNESWRHITTLRHVGFPPWSRSAPPRRVLWRGFVPRTGWAKHAVQVMEFWERQRKLEIWEILKRSASLNSIEQYCTLEYLKRIDVQKSDDFEAATGAVFHICEKLWAAKSWIDAHVTWMPRLVKVTGEKRTEKSENGETWHRTRGSMEVPFAPRSIPRSLKCCPDLSRNSVNSIAWEVVWQKSRTKTSYIHTQILNADEMSSSIANCYVWSWLFQDLRVHFLGTRGGYFMVAEFRTAGLGSSPQGPRFVDPELFQYDSMLGIHWITQHHTFLEVSIIIFDDFWSTGIFWQGRLFAFHLEAQHAEGRGVSLYAGRCSRWQ